MIREVKFESQDRRIKGIIEALNANGIKDIEEANAICESCRTRSLIRRVKRLSLSALRTQNGLML